MRVQEVVLEERKKRYMLLDDNGYPVVPVLKYLKYLDSTGKSRNTQKTYCYSLKQYFDYLGQINKSFDSVRFRDLVEFVTWLQNPYESTKVAPYGPTVSRKTKTTINLTITVVTNFYDYLYRNEEIQNDVAEKLFKQVFVTGRKRYKGFLHHVTKNKPSEENVLTIKVPRKRVRTLTKEQVQEALDATTNIRDAFLIRLLFETGLRIGEALALYMEDFKFDHQKGHKLRLMERGELENGANLKTGEREIDVSQSLMDLYDDYLYEVVDELETRTNFVFVKLRGKNAGKPMTYADVGSLFKRIRKKTGIDLHPHLFRHTHATILYRITKNIKQVQERLGHGHIQTTMNLYVHPSEEDIREEWGKAQSAFELTRGK